MTSPPILWDTFKKHLFIHGGDPGAVIATAGASIPFGAVEEYYTPGMYDPTFVATTPNIAAYAPGRVDAAAANDASLFVDGIDYSAHVIAKLPLINDAVAGGSNVFSIADIEVFVNAVVDARLYEIAPKAATDSLQQTVDQASAAASAAKANASRLEPFVRAAAPTSAASSSASSSPTSSSSALTAGGSTGGSTGSASPELPLCETPAAAPACPATPAAEASASASASTSTATAPPYVLDAFWTSRRAQRGSPAWMGIEKPIRDAAVTAGDVKTSEINGKADGVFNNSRLLWAFKYIDHIQLPQHGSYDSFLEFQVRQLTKVTFLANMLIAASRTVSGTSAADETTKQDLVAALNVVIDLPDRDAQMLGPYNDPSSSRFFDKMYESNSERSNQLYEDQRAIEMKDATMRVVQDNLRSVNSNDELVKTVRFRAFWAAVVVGVLTVAVVAVLYFAYATGRLATMYTVIAVSTVLVLLAEVFRGVGAILRLSFA